MDFATSHRSSLMYMHEIWGKMQLYSMPARLVVAGKKLQGTGTKGPMTGLFDLRLSNPNFRGTPLKLAITPPGRSQSVSE